MTTPDILEKIIEIQFRDICSIDEFDFLSEEDFEKLDEVSCKDTNPRRDYLGTEFVYHNKEDDRYFLIEFYGNEMSHEIYQFHEVTKKVEIKEVISFKSV